MTQHFCYSTVKRRLHLHRCKVALSIRLGSQISTWLMFDGFSHCVPGVCVIAQESYSQLTNGNAILDYAAVLSEPFYIGVLFYLKGC